MIKVNTKTLTAIREGIPLSLIGLSPETLRNLQTSLNPVPAEFKDVEYWDESDVTPAFNSATQTLDSTETLTADAVTKTVKVVRGVRAKTVAELAAEQKQAIAHFEQYTTDYIQGKIVAYNTANGLAFADIDAFTKYAVLATSTHNVIAIRFITYADNIWKALRVYQTTLTAIPTDVQVKAILDAVVF